MCLKTFKNLGPQAHKSRSGGISGRFGAFWGVLGRLWRVLGRLGGDLGRLGAVLGASRERSQEKLRKTCPSKGTGSAFVFSEFPGV